LNFRFYRAFRWDRRSAGASVGGPLYVPRHRQGSGRHDIPERDGVIYASLAAASCAAEVIKSFRGQLLVNEVFERAAGGSSALACLETQKNLTLVDLDDPKQLDKRKLLPSQVVSPQRTVTQEMTRALHDEGVAGFLWWSTLNSGWKNVTLFESRVRRELKVVAGPRALSLDDPDVLAAAKELSIEIDSSARH
jgi:hypothetical protein